METGDSPKVITSRKKILYKPSAWKVHEFEIWSGELLCKVAALRVEGALLLWVGGSVARLGDLALGMPRVEERAALATTLLGADGTAAALARRLAIALRCPVYVCTGAEFDRFTLPLVEKGLITEIKSRPEFFKNS